MSNLQYVEKNIMNLEKTFNELGGNSMQVKFKQESEFAMQLLREKDYKGKNFLLTTAQNNPESLQASIMNIAAVDLSLNPVSKDAYLVPMDGKVCLQVSYRGLCKLSERHGSVRLVQAKIVRKKDDFRLSGATKEPIHNYSPFEDRGEITGVYCIAVLQTGETLTEVMTIKECFAVRDLTTIWQKTKSGPWSTHAEEMIKKTIIKRASKLWPTVGASKHLEKAIHVINESEGIDFEAEKEKQEKESLEKANKAREELKKADKENKDRCKKLIDKIMERCANLCKDRSVDEKISLLNDTVGINSLVELDRKEPKDLEKIVKDLEVFKWPEREMTAQEKEIKKIREGLK